MIFDLANTSDLSDFQKKVRHDIENKKIVEYKAKKSTRTLKQNRAMYLYFTMIADQLNEIGLEFTFQGLKGEPINTRYNSTLIKETLWKPIQMALFEKESTTEINTSEMNEIIDVITKFFAERGVTLLFPSIDTILNYSK